MASWREPHWSAWHESALFFRKKILASASVAFGTSWSSSMVIISSLVHWVPKLHRIVSGRLCQGECAMTTLAEWSCGCHNSRSLMERNGHFKAFSTCSFGVAGMAYIIIFQQGWGSQVRIPSSCAWGTARNANSCPGCLKVPSQSFLHLTTFASISFRIFPHSALSSKPWTSF